jgi:scyllo-inositol 2-dehydrogenase (NADP+)
MSRFAKAADVKVGVIGYGGAYTMGRLHLDQMKNAGMTPTAVAEIDTERLKGAAREFPGIQTYRSVSPMLRKSDVNLLAIITPHNTHAKLAIQCLSAGRHVVCEKPFAITTQECDSMIQAARKRDLMLSAFHNRHWDGCIMEAMEHIRREKQIGEIVRIEAHMGGYSQPRAWWRASKTISGGILYDWGVHLLEYSLQLVDSTLVEVTGFAKRGFWAPKTPWKQDTNEDEATAIARFASGAFVNLRLSSIDANPRKHWLEITGTKGAYAFDHGTYEIYHVEGNQTTVTRGNNRPTLWDRYYRNVADHLVKDKPLVITAEWARRPIHILDLACRSAKAQRAVRAFHR